MTTDLSRLRADAKSLRKSHAKGDPDALARATAVHGDRADLKHADFLHVIAREQGHDSWPKLKFACEAATLTRDEKIRRLRHANAYGQIHVIDRLLSTDPDLADTDPVLQLQTYRTQAIRARIAADPDFVHTEIRDRLPIAYLCFSQYFRARPDLASDMLDMAHLLLDAGANPDSSMPFEPDSPHRLSVLYGALGHAGNLPLAEVLLARGASPDDDESLYHATELGHLDGIRLLLKFNVNPAGTNALNRALDFNNIDMVRLLLDGGADPNELILDHPSGEPIDIVPALHQAARRWCDPDIAALLLDHGADPARIWHGTTAYQVARQYGNDPVARLLEQRGLGHRLTATDRILAACAGGTPPDARLDFKSLPPETQTLAIHIAGRPERLDHLKALMMAGFDPEARDHMSMTALQIAAWEGVPDTVAYLLGLSPDLSHVNGYGGNTLSTALHGADFCPNRATRDHLACVQLLLDAGATVPRAEVTGNGREDIVAVMEDHPHAITD